MATITRGHPDAHVSALKDALDAYEQEHPGARADLYRQNSASVRIRVVDERFTDMTRVARHRELWAYLAARVEEDAMSEVSVLLALAPGEVRDSLGNMDFENPLPSNL